MSTMNPYAATTVELGFAENLGEQPLYQMERKALNKLYYRSCNVTALTGLWCLLLLLLFAMILPAVNNAGSIGFAELTLAGAPISFYLITIIGTMKRRKWGRIMGIIACLPMLLSFPIGTIMGVVGLMAFLKAPELFGDDRITHKELKSVYKDRKKRKV